MCQRERCVVASCPRAAGSGSGNVRSARPGSPEVTQGVSNEIPGAGTLEAGAAPNSAIQSGHLACQDLAAGKGEINTEFDVIAANPSGLSRADASWIIGAAKRAYCP